MFYELSLGLHLNLIVDLMNLSPEFLSWADQDYLRVERKCNNDIDCLST